MRRVLPELVVVSLLATTGFIAFSDDEPSKPPAAEQALSLIHI